MFSIVQCEKWSLVNDDMRIAHEKGIYQHRMDLQAGLGSTIRAGIPTVINISFSIQNIDFTKEIVA